MIRMRQKRLKFKNIPGKSKISAMPIVMIARVYIMRFSKSAVITAVPGILSCIMKKALAGCPPEADGVIAEKYTSAAA